MVQSKKIRPLKILIEKIRYTATCALGTMLIALILANSTAALEVAVIRFFGAQTELTVTFGQWVEIGGAGNRQNEFLREILSRRTSSGQTATSMSVMVQQP